MVLSLLTFFLTLLFPLAHAEDVLPYPDEVKEHEYSEAIKSLIDLDILRGYPDGSYGLDLSINRAEFLTLLMRTRYSEQTPDFENAECFDDIAPGQWYTEHICYAKDQNIVEGYPDGNFRPEQDINLVEMLKVSALSFDHELEESEPWYQSSLDFAEAQSLLPEDFTPDHIVSRALMAEHLHRLIEYSEEDKAGDLSMNEELLTLINDLRAENALDPLIETAKLNTAAVEHSQWMQLTNKLSHTGKGESSPFERCENVGTSCSAENVAMHIVPTAENFFELWENSEGHRANMLGPYSKIGLGIYGDYATTVFD